MLVFPPPPPILSHVGQKELDSFIDQIAAASEGRVLRGLTIKPALINALGSRGETPLTQALKRASGDTPWVVSALLQMGACPSTPSQEGITPLMAVARMENHRVALSCARRLLRAGADASYHDACGQTPLMGLSWMRNHFGPTRKLVKLFLEHGVPLNAHDMNGNTALDLAIAEDHEDLVEIFLDFGATLTRDLNELTDKEAMFKCVARSIARHQLSALEQKMEVSRLGIKKRV